ncbi:MAG: baseplate J/gp47 family protein [Betaproteobacteria bacterium]|nr:baseplate J/gp47 family protein [Betaproteobacteria bacterium]
MQDINSAQITSKNSTVLVALLQKALLRVLAYAQSGLTYELYAYLDWLALQAVPWTATEEFLEGWAALKEVYREAETATIGTVTFSGNKQNIPVPVGTSITRQSDGALFTVTVGASTSANLQAQVTIQAVAAGSAGNFDANTVFVLTSPIQYMQAQSVASAQTTVGTDQELDDSLRTRMLAAYAAPPQGGDRQDYIEWALAVPGVTRAWVSPNAMGAGTVNVFTMFDDAEAAHGGFPQGTNGVATNETRDVTAAGDQLTVANALFNEQPVEALVYSTAPTASPVDFTITGLGANNTGTMQQEIEAALSDMFLRLANVGGTVDPTDGSAWPAIEPNDWYAALSAISGLTTFNVTVPAAAISPASGTLFTLGTVTLSA